MEEMSINNKGLDQVPQRYHHFFLNMEGLDFVEYETEPELRFTLYFFAANKIVFCYNSRFETRKACSIIKPSCHLQNNLRTQRIAICRSGIIK